MKIHFRLKRIFRSIGPGVVAGAADDDPSGIATYSQAGAWFGFSFLWASLFTIPLMVAIQELCARIALVTGRGLVGNLRRAYPRWTVLLLIWLVAIANTVNIGADLGMMAASTQLIVPVSFPLLLFGFSLVTLLLQIFLRYGTYAKYLKYLALSLLAYMFVASVLRIDWIEVLRNTLIPSWKRTPEFFAMLFAFFGTTLSPYVFLWQADQEVEEEKQIGHVNHRGVVKKKPTKIEFHRMRLDVVIGMFASNAVAWFIVLTASAVLFGRGGVEITSAAQIASVLAPIAGSWASVVFAIGVIGTGLLAIPILSSTVAYAVSESFHFNGGLSEPWSKARSFYGIITLITLVGLALNFFGINPVHALIIAAIANGLVAPPLLLAIWCMGNESKLMGRHVSSGWSNFVVLLSILLFILLPLFWILTLS